jgi:hypothetical protein
VKNSFPPDESVLAGWIETETPERVTGCGARGATVD